ncbi:sensor histidine kinase [Actibacterium pelagium]|uniref:C4-dicarboxylate transport sensor protein DctB n=1 Tax=Actibacterium pelagium TaxID=2029103 RepID=A0A917AGK3_9RHOB|nr:ATP-binding protein [Actibacterium pelagium]GGE49919.1 two-component sensor histidine kinase [Actibacterium pelagium]
MTFSWRVTSFILAVVLLALFSAGVWVFAYRNAVDQISQRADLDLVLASDRLTGHLMRYRELAVVLSRHPVLIAQLEGNDLAQETELLLRSMADMTGAFAIKLVDTNGNVLPETEVSDPEETALDPTLPPLARALNGALGFDNRVQLAGSGLNQRVFTFAAPIFKEGGPAIGSVVVDVDIWLFEQNWPTSAAAIFFTDTRGRIFVSNRSELVLTDRWSDEGYISQRKISHWTGHETWKLKAGPYLPETALHIERDLPVVNMKGSILISIAPAVSVALSASAVAAALGFAFVAFLFVASERRRTLAEKLQIEEAANARLEGRVAARTKALSEVNISLRHEIKEREDAEAALRRAQADLVQAGKLSALGKMSAGISHELNQPLMAIRSFAENGQQFAKLGNTEAMGDNLSRISELARRMGRIIKNLRAFARQESEPITNVDLAEVVDAAIELCSARPNRNGLQIDWSKPADPVMVRGGEVRLQQVAVNLISNAIDAMDGIEDQRVEIDIQQAGDIVRLRVRDTGPGLKEPERVFDPFYSTKNVGAAEGMGLGLSISYGLVQSFGGDIRGQNHPEGGALFTVELKAAEAEREAS